MRMLLECNYCGKTWKQDVSLAQLSEIHCLWCKDTSIKVRKEDDTKIDFYSDKIQKDAYIKKERK